MAQVVNTHEAKSRLSALIRAVENGEEVILARNGHPVARIVAWAPDRPQREPGAWRDQVRYDDTLVGPDEDLAATFETSTAAPTP